MNSGVVYARYSSHAQKEASIEQQVWECQKLAENKGIKIMHIYADKALTGKTAQRPEFKRMITDSKRESFKYVLTYKNDRFARNRSDSAIYKKELKKNGVKILYAAETIPDSPEGIVLESVLEGLAEYYSANLSQNVIRGMRDNAHKKKVNGKLPFGYTKNSDGEIIIHQEKAKIINDLFTWVSNGFSVSEYTTLLNNENSPNKQYSASLFYHSLKNERYTGTYIYDDIRVENAFEAIVSLELFGKVQKRLDSRSGKSKNKTFFLTGKLFCNDCGSPMVGCSGTSKNGDIYYYYRCYEKNRSVNKCNSTYVPQQRIESQVKNLVLSELTKTNFISKLIKMHDLDDDLKRELIKKEGKLLGTRNTIENMITAIEAGCYSNSVNSRLGELERVEEILKKEIFEIKIQCPVISTESLTQKILQLAEKAGNNHIEFKKLVNKIVKRVFYDSENTCVEYGLF